MRFLTALALVLVCAATAGAQPRITAGAPLPPASITAPDGVIALELDPAALAYLGRYGVLVAHGEPPQGSDAPRGQLAYIGGAYRGFGVALGVDRTRLSGAPDGGRFSLGVAYGPSRRGAFGLALRRIVRGGARDLTTFDLSMTARPSARFAFSFVAQDILGPSGVGASGHAFPAIFSVNAALRPFGDDLFTVEGGLSASTEGRVDARLYAGLVLPHLGRVIVVASVEDFAEDAAFAATAGLDLRLGSIGVASGVIARERSDDLGYFVAASLEDRARGGLPRPSYVADVRIEGGVGPRGILSIVTSLDRAARDPDVRGVLLRVRRSGIGLAYAQEVKQMIALLERANKPVLCYLEGATGSEIYACAGARRVLLDPASHVRLMGPSVDVVLLGDFLRNIGVHADFVRIGRFKSAPEQLMNSESSGPAREQEEALMDDLHRRLVVDLARDRHVTEAVARRFIDEGPHTAAGAVAIGLADGTTDEHDLPHLLRELHGERVRVRPISHDATSLTWGDPRRVAVVVIDGTIVDGPNRDIPFVGVHQTGSDDVVRVLDSLARDASVGAVILRVDSGGGSALASDRIDRAVTRLRAVKPVIASFGAVAASGGYMVAAGASEILALPSTVTGSIGIFFGKVDVAGLTERIGVNVEQYRRGQHAGADSLYRPFTDEERAHLTTLVEDGYRRFVGRVAEGREMEESAVEAVAQGRIWSGDSASRNGLVDRLAGFGDALFRARDAANLGYASEVVFVPTRPSSLLDYVFEASSETQASDADGLAVLPPALSAYASILAGILRFQDGEALAIMPWASW
jgi:protease-4